MPTITCQYSGIEFQAKSSRAKNHPVVSAVLEEANRVGRYSLALDAIRAARAEGVTDITEFERRARAAVKGDVNKVMDSRRQADEAREAAKKAREAQNAHLRAHGYTWSKVYADFDEYEEGEPSRWTLFSPDRRAVSIAQALDEIERGAEVVLAEIAQQEAEAERAKHEAERKDAEAEAAYEAAKAEVASWPEVKQFTYAGFECVAEYIAPHYAYRRYVHRGEVNGVPCAVVSHYSYDLDIITWRCADPVRAALERVQKHEPQTELEKTFAAFFGEE